MNTAMQGFSFVQAQGPVSMSKTIGSSNPLSGGGENKSFDSILAGFLGSNSKGEMPKALNLEALNLEVAEALNLEVAEALNLEAAEALNLEAATGEELENPEIYGNLVENLLNIQNNNTGELEELKKILERIPQKLNENLEKEIMKYLSQIKESESPKDFSSIKEKMVHLFKENNLLPSSMLKEIFSEGNLKDLSLKEKSDFTSLLGKELLDILKESVNVKVSQIAEKLNSLKEVVTKSTNPLSSMVKISEQDSLVSTSTKVELPQESSKKAESIKETKAEVNSQSNSNNGELKSGSEQVQEKTNLSFQKSLDENISKLAEQQKAPEKVEPKNLPKYIENQIKNSLKSGENGYREITVKIHPEHLGKITLKISQSDDSEMTVKIVAESKNIKEFLDTNITSLRNNLENSGIKNGAFNIDVDFEKNFNQFNGSNQNSSGNPNSKNKEQSNDEQSFEEKIESIFNNSGGLEVLA